ncbi:MAG: NifU family protein [Epsilonproteobacteria bacterium]|nr:NifU family protein [Campylobacterota bacterium]
MIPFSDEELYYAVKNVLPQVSGYVNSHGGGINLLGVKDGVIYIELIGTCNGCSMSLMTTNMVVRRELRRLIHPELFVVNVDGTPENKLPDDIFSEDNDIKQDDDENEKGLLDKVKNIFE